MRSRNYLLHLFLSLTVLFFTVNVNSQTITSTKRFRPSIVTIEFMPSFAVPLPHMYGTVGDFFQFKNYGVKSGVGAHINLKISANKKGTLKPMMTLGYNLFLGNDDNAYIDSNRTAYYPLNGSRFYTARPGSSDIYLHNFRFGLGSAYEFVNKKNKWVPYVSMTLDMNVLFGTYRQQPVTTIGSIPPMRTSYTIKEAVRFGLSIGGGIHLRVTKAFGVMFNMNLRHANLIGKKSKLTTEDNKFELLDESEPLLNTYLNKDRQMLFFDFGLGVNFFIGRK